MPCSPFDPFSCGSLLPNPVDAAASNFVSVVLSQLAEAMANAVKGVVGMLASWVLIPSTNVCPTSAPGGTATADWVQQCNAAASPSAQLRQYVLPITILIAVFGLLWQGIVMTVTRKGEPLLQVLRGLWNTALWGAVGIASTQLALNAGDDFSTWVITKALHDSNPGPPNQAFTAAFGGLLVAQLPNIPVVGIIVGVLILIMLVVQIVLMIFRDGSVVILAGLLQLAAAGSFTRATSPWMAKLTGWTAALVCYKPMAALVYATGLALMSSKQSPNFVMGIAVLALSGVALPAMMKFFNWTVGAAQGGGNGLGMFGAGAAAGLHAASSLRGLGGYSASEHARYVESTGPGSGPTGAGNPPGPSGGPGPSSGGAPAGGRVIDGTVRSATGATATPTTAGAATAGAATSGATTAAGTAATGPAAPIVMGSVVAAQGAISAAKSAAGSASSAMGGE